jgi:hypothetical protein
VLTIDGYRIDVELSCTPSRTNQVTRFPVERGADITDHVHPEPVTLTVDGIVSDTPLGEMIAVRAQFAIINGEAFAKPSEEARARLKKLCEDREPVTVECSAGTFENMILESLNEPRDARTGDSYQFSASFAEVVLVTNDRTTVRTAAPRGKKKVNLGHRAATTLGGKTIQAAGAVLGVPVPSDAADSAVRQLYPSSGVINRRPSILS